MCLVCILLLHSLEYFIVIGQLQHPVVVLVYVLNCVISIVIILLNIYFFVPLKKKKVFTVA